MLNIFNKISMALRNKVTKKSISTPDNTVSIQQMVADGNQLEDAGDFEKAMNLYEQAIKIAPSSIAGYLNKGNLLAATRQYDNAIQMYLKALIIQPKHSATLFNLGNAYQSKSEFKTALDFYEKSLLSKPDFVDAWVAHGNALDDLNRPELSIESYKKALLLSPNYVEVHRNLATCYYKLGLFKEAIESFGFAIILRPESSDNYCAQANVYREMGNIKQALKIARKACEIDPNSAGAHSLLLFCLGHSPNITREKFFDAHIAFGNKFNTQFENLHTSYLNVKNIGRILKIGVVSGDLRGHAVASFFEPIYERLLKVSTLILYIYDTNVVDDHVSQRMRSLIQVKHWINADLMNDDDLFDRIRSDGIDVLIDLSGHTPGHRLPVFARKPAPIQMSWIGYPGTTGLRAMDYFIADRHYLPPGEFDDIFVEKILRLPATTPFSLIENLPDINLLPALKNEYFTFGSFNRLDKISKEVVGLWSKLLLAVNNSKILIGGMPAAGDFNEIIAWFDESGIDTKRLIFHRRSNMDEYLLLHHEVDVCIDTFPYGASTTSCHALSMGVPTITLAGDIPASVSGRAFLSQIGLTDLFVAKGQEDFILKGIWCASNLTSLAKIRGELRLRFQQSNIMQPKIITDSLVCAMRYTWEKWCRNLPVTAFEVVQSNNDFKVIEQ